MNNLESVEELVRLGIPIPRAVLEIPRTHTSKRALEILSSPTIPILISHFNYVREKYESKLSRPLSDLDTILIIRYACDLHTRFKVPTAKEAFEIIDKKYDLSNTIGNDANINSQQPATFSVQGVSSS